MFKRFGAQIICIHTALFGPLQKKKIILAKSEMKEKKNKSCS